MSAVVLEALLGGRWVELGHMTKDTLGGSISTHDDEGRRQLLMFGFVDGEPGVWRSIGGLDVEQGAVMRTIYAVGFEQLSDLSEPYEVDKVTERGVALRVRWRLQP